MKAFHKIIAVVIAVLLLIVYAPAALAFPPLPSSVHGAVRVDGANVPPGTAVSAWINCIKYAQTTTTLYNGGSVFSLDVPGDDPGTPNIIEGGRELDVVEFHVGNFVAPQTGTWHSGVNVQIDIGAPTGPTFSAQPGNLQATLNAAPVGGTISLAAGTYGENLTVDHFVTLNAPIGMLELAGDVNFACGNFVHNGGTVAFIRSGNQHLTLGTPIVFHNVVVNPGTTLVQSGPSSYATASGIVTNNGQVSVAQSVSAPGLFTFGLTGVSIQVTTRGSLSSLQVERHGGNHPAATAPLTTGQYWVIMPNAGAGNYTATLTLPTAFTADAFDKLCRYTAGTPAWNCGTDAVHTHTQNSITRASIAAFGQWTVGNNSGPNAVLVQNFEARPTARDVKSMWLLIGLLIVGVGVIVIGTRSMRRARS